MPTITLSVTDQRRLADALKVLLSPLDWDTTEVWRRELTRTLKPLMRAEKSVFLLPLGATSAFFSEDMPADRQKEYPDVIAPIAKRWPVWERQVRLGAFNRRTLWGPFLEELYDSAYYNEYVIPLRLYEAIGLTRHLGAAHELATGSTVASLWFHHERERRPAFAERGLALLRILYPAFTAGCRCLVRFQGQRASFARSIDGLGEPCALLDTIGRFVHQNPELRQLLEDDPERAVLLNAMMIAGREAGSIQAARLGTRASSTSVEISTRRAIYRLRAILVGEDVSSQRNSVLILLDGGSPRPRSDQTIQLRFGLTAAELRIAHLLASGMTHKAVARQLSLSAHTVRRHSEHIRTKLGVHSTPQMTALLLGGPVNVETAHR